MEVWQRRRHPEQVPAKVAVALADFCRRAGAKGPAAVVREALALLDEAEDFRVLELCDAEPEATPLGPFAAIDVLHGTAAAVAAQREATGYYALARELSGRTVAPEPSEPSEAAAPKKPRLDTPAWEEATQKAQQSRAGKKQARAERSLNQRIAPKRRAKGAQLPPEAKAEPPPGVNVRKRELPLGRGRFVQLTAVKQKVDLLMKADAKGEVSAMLDQAGNRLALLKALERGFAGKKGPLSLADVEKVLERHGLFAALERREHDAIVAAVAANKGSLGRSAFELGVSERDLERLIEGAQAQREVTEIRDRFTKEALSPRNLAQRLDLVGREKYLHDLKIAERFRVSLQKDLEPLLSGALPAANLEQLAEATARKHGLDPGRLRRAMTHAGLDQTFTEKLTA